MHYGLKPTPEDERDYQLGAFYSLPKLEELPDKLTLPYTVKDQGQTDYCSAYTSCAMSEPQEGVELEPRWSFAVSKMLSGDPEEWGQDIRTALKAHVKHGAIEPTPIPNNSRHIQAWPTELFDKAIVHKKQTFWKVTGPYDHFDNIRAALHKFQSPIGTGVDFGWPLSQVYLGTIHRGQGHAMTIVGYTPDSLIYLNSYGRKAGADGIHYVRRDVVNFFVEKYGAYFFLDISREDAQWYLENGIKRGDNWLVQLIKACGRLLVWKR